MVFDIILQSHKEANALEFVKLQHLVVHTYDSWGGTIFLRSKVVICLSPSPKSLKYLGSTLINYKKYCNFKYKMFIYRHTSMFLLFWLCCNICVARVMLICLGNLYASCTHNIIHIHNIIMWDWQYYVEYSSHSIWMREIFYKILLVPHNIVMDLNNVMQLTCPYDNIISVCFKST